MLFTQTMEFVVKSTPTISKRAVHKSNLMLGSGQTKLHDV